MAITRARNRLLNILNISPDLKAILLTTDPVEIKRDKIKKKFSEIIIATLNDEQTIPPLEWVMTRDAVTIFRTIISPRSEMLAGYSLLAYIDDLLNKPQLAGRPEPDPGFFAELEHLLKGVMGKTGIYDEKSPAFAKYEGRKAARLRSADLSRMALTANSILPDGRRVYEFHSWEKKLSLADTYVYTDVSIYNYLKRLKAAGENPADYKTIWYYY
uniref:Uncharacterized protein n=1 Tax=Candidatus Desulfatibia profunda TaxID=2841695 RepID=A0A8J6NSE5_9BACT|nr:hypothetical protein [Candidatus Desulfatibia profunda]